MKLTEESPSSCTGCIEDINTLFSLFHQVKKEIREAVQPEGSENWHSYLLCWWATKFRLVPEAEINPGFLNVGFGDVGYQGVKESEVANIDRGADTQLTWAKGIFSLYIFKNLGLDNSTGTRNPRVL
jgi:hypothetical protein